MIYLLLDTFMYSYVGIFLTTYIYKLHNIKIIELITSLIILFMLSNNIILVSIILIMYLIDHILFKYIKYNFLLMLSINTFFYLILFNMNKYYFINLIIVILLYFKEYNFIGDKYEKSNY